MSDPAAAVARVHREEWGRIVASLIRITGDWSLSEDCAQDAMTRALERWPRDGVPANPGAWLTTVAKHRAMDRLRRAASEANKLREVGIMNERLLGELDGWDTEAPDIADDRLRLVFTCCHPALALDARVALTLRTVAGLTTEEIARAFLVPTPTLAQRLVRAQAKIRRAGIPYRVPPSHLLGERLGGVLAVVYLLFNEGYSASTGDALVRVDLAEEAIRVARLLVALMPEEPEVLALLALLLLQHSRHAARTDAEGHLLSLEEQDRSLWDASAVAEATTLLGARRSPAGPYRLQAEIAACHATAPDAARTDFDRVVRLYDELALLDPSPVVALNRAVAVGLARGPAAGLDLLATLDLPGYHLLPAAQADLHRRLGQWEEAASHYEAAAALARTAPEREYLERRLAEVASRRQAVTTRASTPASSTDRGSPTRGTARAGRGRGR